MARSMKTGSLPDLLAQAFEYKARSLHTAIPGRVEAFDGETGLADVQPMVKIRLVDGRHQSMPVVTDVPIVFPSAGGASITFPVKRGDGVLLIFAERAIEKWLISGREVDAGDRRRHSMTDGMAIPGLWASGHGPSEKANEDAVFSFEGMEVRMKKGGAVTSIKAPTIQLDGNVQCTGNMGVDGSASAGGDLSAGGDVSDGTRSMQDMVDTYNIHGHPDDNTPPTEEMD